MKRQAWYWIAAGTAVAILAALTGKTVMSKLQIAKIEGDAADRYGFPRWWFVALGLKESGLDPAARAKDPRDLARGGAWGVNQITIKTARAHGFTGEPEELLDPIKNAEWTGRILSSPLDRWGVRRSAPHSFAEASSMWNGGFYPGDEPPPGSKDASDPEHWAEVKRAVSSYVSTASTYGDMAERLV